jgi:hypothetical protein
MREGFFAIFAQIHFTSRRIRKRQAFEQLHERYANFPANPTRAACETSLHWPA